MDAEQLLQAYVLCPRSAGFQAQKADGGGVRTVARQEGQLSWDGDTYRLPPEKSKVDADPV